ncbi:MAG TPA: hypothetical protein VFK71_06080 [Gaiellaceae bacterium]|nr:hypothetical protein [Gaiellaceae bacterium]
MRRWRRALLATAGGLAIFALSVALGEGLTMLWLPAVLLGASWPRGPWRRCRERP